jgi:hypothetical protein
MKKLLLSFLLLACSNILYSQITVSGKIISLEDGIGIPGVNVIEKDTSTGTVTDIDGNYTISIKEEKSVLIFSFVGFTTQEVVVGNRSAIDLELEENVETLGEIVVTEYYSSHHSTLSVYIFGSRMCN